MVLTPTIFLLHPNVGAYGLIASFCFFWIPLSYFYYEELHEGQSIRQRLAASLKYTIFFILVACTLLFTGLFMKPNDHDNKDLEWLRKMLTDLGKSNPTFYQRLYLIPVLRDNNRKFARVWFVGGSAVVHPHVILLKK